MNESFHCNIDTVRYVLGYLRHGHACSAISNLLFALLFDPDGVSCWALSLVSRVRVTKTQD